jgi:RimJ/RimL family protein N-acetyltransferase
LYTERLALRPASLELAVADLEDRSRFANLLGAEIPGSWPPELYDLGARRWVVRAFNDGPEGSLTYYFLLKREPGRLLLIGVGGFKGKPKDGTVEIGYSIVPEWQGQGLGADAVRVLTQFAFEQLGARVVCAHTLRELLPSRRVLEKNGFALRGTPTEEGAIRYEISYTEWNQKHHHHGKFG